MAHTRHFTGCSSSQTSFPVPWASSPTYFERPASLPAVPRARRLLAPARGLASCVRLSCTASLPCTPLVAASYITWGIMREPCNWGGYSCLVRPAHNPRYTKCRAGRHQGGGCVPVSGCAVLCWVLCSRCSLTLLRPPPPPPTIGPAGPGLLRVLGLFVLFASWGYSASGPMVGVWCRVSTWCSAIAVLSNPEMSLKQEGDESDQATSVWDLLMS